MRSAVASRTPRTGRAAALRVILGLVLSASVSLPAGCATVGEGGGEPERKAPRGGVWWAGDGEWLVAQLLPEGEPPYVIAWERETDEILRYDDGRVVAVEEAEAVVWLAPDADSGAHGRDIAGDGFDSQPDGLLVWDLAETEATDDVEARWRPWPGPGGYSAYLEVDPLKGALPAKLLFQPKSFSGEGVKAALPDDVGTFEPLGWSPDGEHFAVKAVEQPSGGSADGAAPRRIFVVSASTGKVDAEAGSALTGLGRSAAWGAERSVLFLLPAEEITEGRSLLHSLVPLGEPLPLRGPGWEDPRPEGPIADVGLLGPAPVGDSVFVALATGAEGRGAVEIWSAGVRDEMFVSLASGASIAYHPGAGLGVLSGDELAFGDIGGDLKTVWEAE